MKNTFGQSLQITLFGESHGPYIGAVLDGLAPGIKIDEAFIESQLDLRRPAGKISTARVEADKYIFASGVYKGYTTGTPLCILIPNEIQRSKDYEKDERIARPGHADFTANEKYHGYEDFRGGGHFSGRITAALVAAGAIAISALKSKNIEIGTHILKAAGVCDRSFDNITEDIKAVNGKMFAVLDESIKEEMLAKMTEAAEEGDSVGGILETAVTGMPAGVGEPWFDTVEGILSHALYSIPAIKGVEFGIGFNGVDLKGSQYNDPFRMEGKKVVTTSNNNGGVNGGITNGMPISFRCAVKPTPSIYKKQESIELYKHENADLQIEGRHDPAIIHRARVVVDSMTAIVIYDMLSARFGTDFFGGDK